MKTGPVFTALFLVVPLFSATSNSSMAIDGSGNIWRTGRTQFLATTSGAFQKSSTGGVCATYQLSPFDAPATVNCNHAFVTKQDSTGQVVYATYLAGATEDGGMAITTDAQGNVYVAGFTYSADFPVTTGAAQVKSGGPNKPSVISLSLGPFGPVAVVPGGDVFVAKFAPDGTLVYSTLLGGSGQDIPAVIGVDASGSVYVAGSTGSLDFPVTANAMTAKSGGNFFARLSPAGATITYSTYSVPTIQAFAMDDHGEAYLTGFAAQPPAPLTGNGGPYVTAVDTAGGTVTYSTFLPAINAKISGAGSAIALGGSGTVFVGVSPPATPGALIPLPLVRPLGAANFLVIAADGKSILSEQDFSQTQVDTILVDASGNAYAFGHGTGTLPATPNPLLAAPCASAGGSFVMETGAAGNVLAATYLRQADDSAVATTAPGKLLLYRGASNNTIPLDLTAQPAMNFGCLENLGSGIVGPGVAPGEIFMIFGYGLGPAQGIGAAPDASGNYPTSLGGVQLLINGKAAPLLFVQAGEIHSVAPFALPSTVSVTVTYNNQSAPLLDAPGVQLNPGIFEVGGQGAIINADGTVNTPANPAKLGSYVSIYGTGTGYLESPVTDGQLTPIPPPFIILQYTPQVTFAGMAGTTLWSGAAPGEIAGVTQINVQLPAALPAGTALNAVPVVLNSSGVLSPPAMISVKQ
jgi:uncharacterized protein (TIGR03437 family)